MNCEMTLEQLLRWRLAGAEADAPPPPRASRLLELARAPWWEIWPERFRAQVERLGRIQVAYGFAMAEPSVARGGYPVPTLISQADDLETFARVLYLSVQDGRLRLRFQLDAAPGRPAPAFEVTFISDGDGGDAESDNGDARPLLAARATRSVGCEYRLDSPLGAGLARGWGALKVTDRMPFRFILNPVPPGE